MSSGIESGNPGKGHNSGSLTSSLTVSGSGVGGNLGGGSGNSAGNGSWSGLGNSSNLLGSQGASSLGGLGSASSSANPIPSGTTTGSPVQFTNGASKVYAPMCILEVAVLAAVVL